LTWAPTVCVVGTDRIAKLLGQHDSRLSRGEMLFSTLVPRGALRYMACDKQHGYYRPLLAQAFVVSGDDPLRTIMSRALRLELEHMAALCSAPNSSGIRPHRQVSAALLRIFITVIFGAKQNSPELARIEALYGTLNCRNLAKGDLPAARQALNELNDQVRALVGPREASGDRCGFRNLAQKHPNLLADDTAVGNIVVMVQVGSFDVASLLVWIWKYLSDFPQWRDRLRREVESGSKPVKGWLADRIISETLRLDQSEYLKRTALETLEFDGYRIPKGWNVQMCLRESHQNPTYFSSPLHFNPDRFLGDSTASLSFAPFGIGPKRCPAQQLTYLLATDFLCELTSRYSWRVVADGPRHHDGVHWTPNPNFRVELNRIDDQE
jgi:cytochrome P450